MNYLGLSIRKSSFSLILLFDFAIETNLLEIGSEGAEAEIFEGQGEALGRWCWGGFEKEV